jgi:large subunit ribosomal protein L29
MKAEDLRKNDINALNETLKDLLKDQFNLRMKQATGQLGTNHQIKQVRRDIARVKTIINEKSKGAE